MKATALDLPEVLVLEPTVFADDRGRFYESYNRRRFAELTGSDPDFVQDNQSISAAGVLRGLHYQLPPAAQGKLVRVVAGEIFDVAVDIRRSSPRFGQWVAARLGADGLGQMWIPTGFAHGFLVLSETAEVLYKTTDYYSPEHERCIRWDDPDIGIDWPLAGAPLLSPKDAAGVPLAAADAIP
jgi:dTDP-4-dehydrorhamnose 3,5-epimerase